jgi:hypothetical protein
MFPAEPDEEDELVSEAPADAPGTNTVGTVIDEFAA